MSNRPIVKALIHDSVTPEIGLEIDALTGNIPVVSRAHHLTHEEKLYEAYYLSTSTAAGGSVNLYIRPTTTVNTHLSFHADTEAKALIRVYEALTTSSITNTGTALNVYSTNRASSATTLDTGYGTYIAHTPTWTTTNMTLLPEELIPGGTAGRAGGLETDYQEKIYAAGKEYIIQVINLDVGAQDIGVGIEFYIKDV